MSEPTKENISLVLRGFEEFYQFITRTKTFDFQQFVNFMEPIFKTAGYRNSKHPSEQSFCKMTRGGGEYFNYS